MTFRDAYEKVNTLFNNAGIGDVAVAGETDNMWLFKSRTLKRDKRTPVVFVVDRNKEEVRSYFSPTDHIEAGTARIVDLSKALA